MVIFHVIQAYPLLLRGISLLHSATYPRNIGGDSLSIEPHGSRSLRKTGRQTPSGEQPLLDNRNGEHVREGGASLPGGVGAQKEHLKILSLKVPEQIV
jgi:hypothetical protein